MRRPKEPPLEQLFLLVLLREQSATIPELVDRFDKTYEVTARVMRHLRDADLAKVTAVRPHTDRHPACHVFAPTAAARGALKIFYETPLPPKLGIVPAERTAPPAADCSAAPSQNVAEPAVAEVPDDDGFDAPPVRLGGGGRSGSGVIAGPITIGRGYRWGGGRA